MAFDHLDQPGWDRALAVMFTGWDERLVLLDAALDELRETQRRAARLDTLDQDLTHWTSMRDEARSELVDLDRRRKMTIEKAVEDAGQKAIIGRAKRMEAARAWAEELQDEQQKGQRRVAMSKMAGAQREVDKLHNEVRVIGSDPLYRDEQRLAWLAQVGDVITAIAKRDRRARSLVATPWLQRQAIDEMLLRDLRRTIGESIVQGAAFAEGSIHVMGTGTLAVVEMREGDDDVHVIGEVNQRRLLQPKDGQDVPAGAITGSMLGLLRAADLVQQVTGARAHTIICFHGWKGQPAKVDETILCGPKMLPQVLAALPPRQVLPNDLEAIAGALVELPVPHISVPQPAPMSQLTSVAMNEVPAALEALRNLVQAAHSTDMDIDLREAVGARG